MEGTAYFACKSGQRVACISGYKIVFKSEGIFVIFYATKEKVIKKDKNRQHLNGTQRRN